MKNTNGIRAKNRYKISGYLVQLLMPIRNLFVNTFYPIYLENIKSKIRTLEGDCTTIECYVNLLQNVNLPLIPFPFFSNQKESEILGLLNEVSKRDIKYMVEIGTGNGGTLYIFCKTINSQATIITVDINMPIWLQKLLESYSQPKQNVIVMKADSHKEDTFDNITELLKGNKLDFLFIDGDHSYNGVKQDFLVYSRLVAKGGLIAFHDIIPDYKTRYGIRTSSYTGGVPIFWDEIKKNYRYLEFVADSNQDGYGIGVLIWK